MKQRTTQLFLILPALILISFRTSPTTSGTSVGVQQTLDYFVTNTEEFTKSAQFLYESIDRLDSDPATVKNAREKLAACRLHFKKIEFFTEYFFNSETRMYNAPPVYEVEEPTLELVEPMGLQQIESLLFEDDVIANKEALMLQAEALYTSVKDLKSLLYQFEITDAQILESLRIELIRMMTLSVTGYDAPSLKTGIVETLTSTIAIREILYPYIQKDHLRGDAVNLLLAASIDYLSTRQDFDTFDRMAYLTRYGLPLQKKLGELIRSLDLDLNTTTYLNYDADHLFSPDAFKNLGFLADSSQNKPLIRLGETLFSETALSGTLTKSCASCHMPSNYFNDNLIKSPSLHKDSTLRRHTPTLLYAGRQHMQFWDGRSEKLEDQIKNVIFNPLEMGGKTSLIKKQILQNGRYQSLFKLAFPAKPADKLGVDDIAEAIAAYVGTLGSMNAPFDRYLRGDQKALTDDQIDGFNLFMGKAQCGTCHFPPFFNSLLPPLFDISEVEVLGSPANDDLNKPLSDKDPGRYDLYHIRYYRGAFKTPTVRNAAKTAPYMHNGALASLKTVMDFYNRGGGTGLGLALEDQTLSSSPLNLNTTEIEHIISFIDALTDYPE
jgi:cytochrome c peroxidase